MVRAHLPRDLVVRPARASDVDALSDLVKQFHLHQGDPTEHFTPAAVRREILARGRSTRALVAELDGAVVGFALLLPAFESPWAASGLYVGVFHVVETARKRGVGRALMAACAAEAKRQRRGFLWWVSKAWNVDAHHFYHTIGAIEEPVMAHALTYKAFEKLADEGRAHLAAHRRVRRREPKL